MTPQVLVMVRSAASLCFQFHHKSHLGKLGWMVRIAVAMMCVCTDLARRASCSEPSLSVTAWSCDAERPITAPHTSGARPGMPMGAPCHESDAPAQPPAAQLKLAERIADAVAARLNQREALSSAEPRQQDPSSGPSSSDAAPANAAPQAAGSSSQGARQPSPNKQAVAEADPSQNSLVMNKKQGHVCEEEFLTALLQGSPGRPSSAGQPGRLQACEQDFLAALLMTPGSSERSSNAASPGLMHKDSCSNSDMRFTAVNTGAESGGQPWSAQWAGKLTQQQMETAVHEV